MLQTEFEFYLKHQEEMIKKYDGKYIVIKDKQILGTYDSDFIAVTQTAKVHTLGTFLVQKVSEGDIDYSQTFYSPRVTFS